MQLFPTHYSPPAPSTRPHARSSLPSRDARSVLYQLPVVHSSDAVCALLGTVQCLLTHVVSLIDSVNNVMTRGYLLP